MPKGYPLNPCRAVCMICGKTFDAWSANVKTCSIECRQEGHRASWRKYGVRNRKKKSIYNKRRREEHPDKFRAESKRWRASPAGKKAQAANGRRQRIKFPEKYQARQEVLKALRSGRLVREPCRECGAPKAQAHHHDYSKPLDVEWLCLPCHRAVHPSHSSHGEVVAEPSP